MKKIAVVTGIILAVTIVGMSVKRRHARRS